MRILLVGEYSGLHNNLKKGLLALGHHVTLLGNRDGFKGYPVDLQITAGIWEKRSGAIGIVRKTCMKMFGIDLDQIARYRSFRKNKHLLKNYDIVQLINETALQTSPKLERKAVEFLKEHNEKLFLLSCGDDHHYISYLLKRQLPYSILSAYFEDPALQNKFRYSLKYVGQDYKDLSVFIYNQIEGVIATDLDYHMALKDHKKYLGLAPNPVDHTSFDYQPLDVKDRVVIFHGINSLSSIKKGSIFFDKALEVVKKKYGDKIIVIRKENVPHKDYIKSYEDCHILLDQVYSYDQGYNALEAMARGKVVFTGAGKEFTDHYRLDDSVAIDATPEVEDLIGKLSFLIENPKALIKIGNNARRFIEKYHDPIAIARHYESYWKLNFTVHPEFLEEE